MSTGVFFLASKCDWRSRSLKKTLRLHSLVGSKIRLASWLGCVIYFTDRLMTPYFSGGCTVNGTPGGDRWARVLRGQIGWLSDPLRRVHAGCSWSTNEFENANSWKARKNPAPPKTHHEIHSGLTTASNSREHARKHVPRVSPYSLASIDPGFLLKSASYSSRNQ